MPATNPQWTVTGRSYNTTSGRVGNAEISLPTTSICIPSMPDSSGKPISKVLAEMYISNLMFLFNKVGGFAPSATPTTVLEVELSNHIKEIGDFFALIIDASHGVTFDKDLILKILSQPKCEGIRCYLCAKGPDSAPQVTDTKQCGVSLVVVGVGDDGKDLNWPTLAPAATPAPAGTIATAITPLNDDGSSPSLAGEYGTPPTQTLEAKKMNPDFALLKNALNLL